MNTTLDVRADPFRQIQNLQDHPDKFFGMTPALIGNGEQDALILPEDASNTHAVPTWRRLSLKIARGRSE